MFLTLEGVEGSGKSTLARLLAERAATEGIPLLRTREPGGCGLGLRIRPLLLDASTGPAALCDRAELFLFLADRAQHVAEIIRPALAEGIWVLCDRYADSTIAYQGYGRGLNAGDAGDMDWLERLNDFATGGLWPDVTLLLDLPPEEGLKRALARNRAEGLEEAEGRFEAETLAFHARIREGFLARAAAQPGRFHVLNALLPPEELAAEAWAVLLQARGSA